MIGRFTVREALIYMLGGVTVSDAATECADRVEREYQRHQARMDARTDDLAHAFGYRGLGLGWIDLLAVARAYAAMNPAKAAAMSPAESTEGG